jgi:hypothetical protein
MLNKIQQPKSYKNQVYMNFNINTNPGKRELPYNILKNKPWVTVRMGANGQNYDDYLDNIYNHKFVICPEGNGIDTHRIWECLYMGTIPIVSDNINNAFYRGLPICIVDDWGKITEDFLDSSYGVISARAVSFEKLTFNYWKNKILDMKYYKYYKYY